MSTLLWTYIFTLLLAFKSTITVHKFSISRHHTMYIYIRNLQDPEKGHFASDIKSKNKLTVWNIITVYKLILSQFTHSLGRSSELFWNSMNWIWLYNVHMQTVPIFNHSPPKAKLICIKCCLEWRPGGHFAWACLRPLNNNSMAGASNLMAGDRKPGVKLQSF